MNDNRDDACETKSVKLPCYRRPSFERKVIVHGRRVSGEFTYTKLATKTVDLLPTTARLRGKRFSTTTRIRKHPKETNGRQFADNDIP